MIEPVWEGINPLFLHVQLSAQVTILAPIPVPFVKDNGDVYIIEAGARSGATGIPEIISINTGIDYYELIIKAALGENNHLSSKINNIPCASLLIYSNKTGIYDGYMFDGIEGIDINIDYKKGDVINKIEDGTDRVGIAIIKGSTKNEIINKIGKFKSMERIKVTKKLNLLKRKTKISLL